MLGFNFSPKGCHSRVRGKVSKKLHECRQTRERSGNPVFLFYVETTSIVSNGDLRYYIYNFNIIFVLMSINKHKYRNGRLTQTILKYNI